MRVLIVEDNEQLMLLEAERLGTRGFSVDVASRLSQADDFLSVGTYDCILLDLGMPDGDGLNWLSGLGPNRPPALVLTARGTLEDRVRGLDKGADDYLVKPAEADEIAARLRAIARRPGPRQDTLLEVGPFKFDTIGRQVFIDERYLPLGTKETEMFAMLLKSAGRVVPRERLEASIYGPMEAVTPNALDALASRLRKRISSVGIEGVLHTVRGVGYYLEVGETE